MTTAAPAIVKPHAARVETSHGRRFAKCAVCGRTLGELTAGKLIVKAGDRIIRLPLVGGTVIECPRCCGESELEAA